MNGTPPFFLLGFFGGVDGSDVFTILFYVTVHLIILNNKIWDFIDEFLTEEMYSFSPCQGISSLWYLVYTHYPLY